MVILLGLAAAVLYGSGDFLGGMATRRAHVLTVLMLAEDGRSDRRARRRGDVARLAPAWPAWPGGSAPA